MLQSEINRLLHKAQNSRAVIDVALLKKCTGSIETIASALALGRCEQLCCEQALELQANIQIFKEIGNESGKAWQGYAAINGVRFRVDLEL